MEIQGFHPTTTTYNFKMSPETLQSYKEDVIIF